ncbi:41129_t:CDS:2, partial [Gigaspora margarita]
MNKHSNFLPSNDQLAVLAKGCVSKNTVKNTEGWIKIMNQWWSDVNYKEPLENQDKETINFNGHYSRTSLKNALSAINRYLQNVKPVFFWISILGAVRDSEHMNLHILQIVDTPDSIIFRKTQQKNNQGNKWYLDKALGDHTIHSLFKTICIEYGINVESRNISNHSGRRTSIIELFNIRVPENTGHAISRYKSSGGYYAYAKPTNKHKREALANILNKLINTIPSNETAQDLTINTILSNEMAQDSIEQINPESNNNKESQSIRFEDDELSDADLNNSSQVEQNEHEFYGKFHTAQEILNNSHKRVL